MARPTSKEKRQNQATALLENETLLAIFDERELEIIDRWRGSDSVEERESCHSDLTALEGLRDAIYAAGND